MKSRIQTIAYKELSSYFSSPIAYIFLGTFLAVNLFVFFWGEAFFARNIADVRPLFEWMPVLLVFLVAALTMKTWSDEQRMGTMELLLTSPLRPLSLVLGKFLACMALVAAALVLTFPIPMTVALLPKLYWTIETGQWASGGLDWGPVVGGYLAALFLSGAYVAVGLYVSSRTDSQIVSLIMTVLVCSVLYLFGSDVLSAFFGYRFGEFLRLVGTGSRFESITRGVIDFRDIYYYLSIIAVFLSLNVYSLESRRWSQSSEKQNRRHKEIAAAALLVSLNCIVANFWLQSISKVRFDLTASGIYSISPATRSVLKQLHEPLFIRGYFSAKTHPLLAPLVPRLRDLIREYAVVGGSKVRAEFVDPREDPKLEEEASQKYGVKPIPFQFADKYQASLVNSYFDIVVQYGDKYETLDFRDLIEVRVQGETDIDVQLRNPEYDITRSIKKALYGFQNVEELFAGLSQPVTFHGYISPAQKLPEALQKFLEELQKALQEMEQGSDSKLKTVFEDPEADGGKTAKKIAEDYGFQPMVAGLFDTTPFYFYLTLESDKKVVQLGLPEDLTAEGAKKLIEAGLKRLSPGFLRTVGIHTAQSPQGEPWMQQMAETGRRFDSLNEKLSESHRVESVDLKSGLVPEEVDLLLLAAPEKLSDKQVFAVDQFLMRGGTVVVSAAPYSITRSRSSLTAEKTSSGLEDWLRHNGFKYEDALVLDPSNEPYPVPERRSMGAFVVERLQLVPYPFFVDVRGEGIGQDIGITEGLAQVTMNWPSPLLLEEKEGIKTKIILKSSPESWKTTDTEVIPEFRLHSDFGFPVGDQKGPFVLAALAEGRFESFFKGKKSPLLEEDKKEEEQKPPTKPGEEENKEEKKPVFSGLIEQSPESARLIVFSSNEFMTDQTLGVSASTGLDRYRNTLQLVENVVDWSLEDPDLLTIRNRGNFSRTLLPMTRKQQLGMEYLNYLLALLGTLAVYGIYRLRRSALRKRHEELLAGCSLGRKES